MYSGEHAETKGHSPLRKFLNVLVMILAVIVLSQLLRTFVFKAYQIPSESMAETIVPGDMVFSEKISYLIGDVEPGDIVTFQNPDPASREKNTLIKRVIAVGGQTLDLDENGNVIVDGVRLNEPYTNGLPSWPLTTLDGVRITYPITIEPGYVWVMGDNRVNSNDSRYFGPIPEDSITGRAAVIYWPLSDAGFLS